MSVCWLACYGTHTGETCANSSHGYTAINCHRSCCVLAARYEDSTARKKLLEDELSDLEAKLLRAEKLVTGTLIRQCSQHECMSAECTSVHACMHTHH